MNKRGCYCTTTAILAIAMVQSSAALAQTVPAGDPAPPAAAGGGQDRVQAQQPAATGPAAQEDIIVTGSRLRNPTLTSPSPLQVIDQQAIKREAFINVQDAIQMNPAFGNPGNSRTSSNSSRTGTGLSTIGLRNAGPNLTLVLVDGRRVVPAAPGSSAVDVGFIPTGFIDRVEILTGGASAVYGSDAIAGVVNFIYKKHFDGIQASAQAGLSERGDDGEYQTDLTIGRNFAGGRGNALFYASWSRQDYVPASARDYTAGGYTSLGTQMRKATRSDDNVAAAQNLFVPVGIYGNVTPSGLFTAGGKNYTVNGDGTGRPINTATDIYNGAPYGALASPLDRFNFAGRINYEIADHMNVFVEGTYGRTKTTAYLNPIGLTTSGGLGVFRATNGYYNIESYINQANGTIKVRNPLVPDAIYNAATDVNGDGLKDISASRRMNEYGQFRSNTNRDQFQFTIGTEGDLGSSWNYQAYYSYGVTTASQVTNGVYNQYNMAYALEAIPDINDLDKDGNRTEAICANAEARASGCVPANIYGAATMSPEAIAYTRANVLRDARQTLENGGVSLSGSVFTLPAGAVQVAVGAEYRREASRETFDPLANAGRNGYAQQVDTGGSFTVKEAYGELQVPLLANTPFFHNLTARGAVRASDYSSMRRTFLAYNGGFEWAPIRDIRFRGTYAHATRAPNISELYRPAQTTIDSVTDPCKGITFTSTGRAAEICRQDPTIVANMNAHGGVFTLNNQDQSGVTTYTAPNPNLREQSASTWTFGAVINPVSIPALRNLTITADYYKLFIGNGIGGQNISSAADLCYNQGQDYYCSVIRRRAADTGVYSVGSIEFYASTLTNNNSERLVEGLDFSLSYLTSLGALGLPGNLSMSASYSHLLRSYSKATATAARRNLKGELGTASDPATVSVSYDDDSFGFTLTGQYQPPYYFDQPFRLQYLLADGTPVDKKYFRIPPYIYTNAQVRLKVGTAYQLFLGVKNLTDTRPPGLWGGLPGNNYVYDQFGRRFYVGLRLNL